MRALIYFAATSITMALAADAFATPYFEAIDMGVPRNGSTVMTGYHGYVIRAVSDEGRIRAIDVGNFLGTGGFGIGGGLAQRWEDPTASGRNYTVRTPGPFTANNTFDSDLNFDSHFTFDPATVVLQPIRGEPNSSTLMTATYEYSRDVVTADNPYMPGFMPLPSTSSVLYSVGRYGPTRPDSDGYISGELLGSFQIVDAARSGLFPFAYVVSNTGFEVAGGISIENGTSYGVVNSFVVPEPVAFSSFVSLLLLSSPRASRSHRVS